MSEEVPKLDPKTAYWLGAVIVAAGTTVNGTVLLGNSTFVYEEFGFSFAVTYVAAAICYTILPWIRYYLECPVQWTKAVLLGFIFWVSCEETSQASVHFDPQMTTSALSFAAQSAAHSVAVALSAAAVLVVIEFIGHLHYHALVMMLTVKR
jgi:hypothetical protein